jgi:penicillin-binding protein 1A
MPTPSRRSVFWRLRRLWYVAGVLAVATVSGVGYVLAQVPLPDADVPVETTFLYDADGNKLAELSTGENRVSVSLDQVSFHLLDAVLAVEDRDFFAHPGVDATAILRATIADLRGRPLQGGSTITQQYVKNVFVGNERTIVRKLKEATLAVKLERKLAKGEILERYLNTVYFGRGAYGVQAAAKAYFDTSVDRLDIRQSAYLAGLIRAPEAADASTDPDAADLRRDLALLAMREERLITEEQHEEARAERVVDYARPRDDVVRDRYVDAEFGTQYFVEHVRRQLQSEGFTDGQINGGGLRVYTSLDLDLQRAAYTAVYTDTLNQPDDPAGALVAVDTGGYVRAMVGGRDWNAADDPYARVNFALGAGGGGTGRQPGSAFKPFALATAVADGYTVESAFDSPATLVFPKANNGEDYKVTNYGRAAHGRLNLVDATRVSSNTVYAQLVEALGPQRIADLARRLGITSEVAPVLSIALGTSTVSVLDMADAYLTFATRGIHVAPAVIVRVTDAEGRVLWEEQPRQERVLDPEEADIVTHALREVVRAGTGTRAALDVPVAGKTGTTQQNGDAWFVGYTPGLSTAVWMGYPEGQRRQMDAVHGIQVTGGTLPAEAFRRFMAVATMDPRYAGSFGPVPELSRGKVLSGSGRLSTESTTTTTTAPEETPEETTTTVEPAETTTTSAPEQSTTTTSSTTTTTTSSTTTTTTTTEPPGPQSTLVDPG